MDCFRASPTRRPPIHSPGPRRSQTTQGSPTSSPRHSTRPGRTIPGAPKHIPLGGDPVPGAWAPILAITYFKPRYRKMAALGLLVLLSHPVIDMMGSSTPILWPLLDTSIHISLSLNGKVGEGVSLIPRVEVQRTATVFKQVTSIDYPLFTGEGLTVSLLLLIPLALNLLRERRSAGNAHGIT
jgi:hypothetical protein